MAKNRNDIMAKAIAEINKKYPDSTLGKYKDLGSNVDIDLISTGSLVADHVLGGGLARMTEIFGHTSSGKTTLAITAAAKMQEDFKSRGEEANILYCDAEFTFDPKYARSLGLDVDNIYLLQPESSEEGYNIIEAFISSGVADLVVVDSIAAMIPKEITDGDIGKDSKLGSMATLTTKAVSRINRLSKNFGNTHIIWINQYKPQTKIGMFDVNGGTVNGSSWYLPGGSQQQFYQQQLVEIKRSGQIKEGDKVLSNVITISTKKNKVGIPYLSGEYTLTFGKGLDISQEIIGLGLKYGHIKAAGSFYSIPDLCEDRIQGRAKLGPFLDSNPEILQKLIELCKKDLDQESLDKKIEIDRSSSDDSGDGPIEEDVEKIEK